MVLVHEPYLEVTGVIRGWGRQVRDVDELEVQHSLLGVVGNGPHPRLVAGVTVDTPSLWCDVIAFDQALARARAHGRVHEHVDALSGAVTLYEGDFLSGLTLRDAIAFDEWQRAHAERLRNSLADALQELTSFHAAHDDEQALTFAERWMMLDPLDERSHESSMRPLLSSGRRGAALRLYDAYAHRLDHELGIDPPESMTELRRAVRSRNAPVVEAHRRERHDGRYHAKLLRDARAYKQVTTDFESIAAAWRWACRQRAVELIDGALDAVHLFADRNGLYHDGIGLLEDAFATVDEGPVLGRLLSRQAVLYGCIGQLEKAHALLEASLVSPRTRATKTKSRFARIASAASSSLKGAMPARGSICVRARAGIAAQTTPPDSHGRSTCSATFPSVRMARNPSSPSAWIVAGERRTRRGSRAH